jgi:hypothetical protein
MLEMSKLLPRIIREFDFELVAPPGNLQKRFMTRNYWFVKPSDFKVKRRRGLDLKS